MTPHTQRTLFFSLAASALSASTSSAQTLLYPKLGDKANDRLGVAVRS